MAYSRTELEGMKASEVRELAAALDLEYTTKPEAIEDILAKEGEGESAPEIEPAPPVPEPEPIAPPAPVATPLELKPDPTPPPVVTTPPKAAGVKPKFPSELLTRLGQPLCRNCGAPKATDRHGKIVCAQGNSDRSQCIFK